MNTIEEMEKWLNENKKKLKDTRFERDALYKKFQELDNDASDLHNRIKKVEEALIALKTTLE